jgi:TfoX/Sxy family transcriptional regulator of competence genes
MSVKPGSTIIGNETDTLLERTRAALSSVENVFEKPMFGSIGFLLEGNLLAAASKRGLLLRLGKERWDEALSRPGITPMQMRGKDMPGYVYLDPATVDGAGLKEWLNLALNFVKTLPPKSAAAQRKQRKGQ